VLLLGTRIVHPVQEITIQLTAFLSVALSIEMCSGDYIMLLKSKPLQLLQ